MKTLRFSAREYRVIETVVGRICQICGVSSQDVEYRHIAWTAILSVYRQDRGSFLPGGPGWQLAYNQAQMAIQAEKDASLRVIPAESYRKIMDESAPLSNFTSEVMAARFSDVMWLIEQILWKSFDRRLAAFLLEEAAIEGSPALRITHEIIGNHMGNPREVVTRMLRYFQSEGMVRLSRGTVDITDERALRRLAE